MFAVTKFEVYYLPTCWGSGHTTQ